MLKLTIAIPTFNGGKNLERAINSCKNIQLPSDEYEILVVDNCSTDESISNVKELRKQISNLVLIQNLLLLIHRIDHRLSLQEMCLILYRQKRNLKIHDCGSQG